MPALSSGLLSGPFVGILWGTPGTEISFVKGCVSTGCWCSLAAATPPWKHWPLWYRWKDCWYKWISFWDFWSVSKAWKWCLCCAHLNVPKMLISFVQDSLIFHFTSMQMSVITQYWSSNYSHNEQLTSKLTNLPFILLVNIKLLQTSWNLTCLLDSQWTLTHQYWINVTRHHCSLWAFPFLDSFFCLFFL